MVERMTVTPKTTSESKEKQSSQNKHQPKRQKPTKLKSARRKWLPAAIAGVTLLGAGVVFNSETVLASVNGATMSVRKATGGTEFDQKDDLAKNKDVQAEGDKAFDGIDGSWTDNTVDEVKAEIARQQEAGLPIYVIQWGDTLSVLAEALGTSVDGLAKLNAIQNDDLILTGDILLGVLSTGELSKDKATDVDPAEQTEPAAKDDANVDAPSVAKEEDAATTVDPTVEDDGMMHILPIDEDIKPIIEVDDSNDEIVAPDEPVTNEPTAPITPVDVDKEPEPNPDPAELPADMIVETPLDVNPDIINDPLEKPVVVDDSPTVIPVEPVDDSVGDDVDKDIIVEQDATMITYDAVTTIKKGINYVADDTLEADKTKVMVEGKDGSIKQTHAYGAYSDGEIVHDIVGDETRVEAEPQVIHYGPTETKPVTVAPIDVMAGRTIKSVNVTGDIQANVFSYFVESDLFERLTAAGYSLESTDNALIVLANPDDINADALDDLQLTFAYNATDKPLDYKLIDKTNDTKQGKQVLASVEKLNALFNASKLETITAEAKGVELNAIVMTLIEWSFTNQDATTSDAINNDYQTFMSNMETSVAEHMESVRN